LTTVNAVADFMSEQELVDVIIELCGDFHLKVADFRPAQTAQGWRTAVQGDGVGYPDLTIVGPRGVLFREVKSSSGRLTTAQAVWVGLLGNVADAGVWVPADWRSGLIELELRGISRRLSSSVSGNTATSQDRMNP
jgi:hypothetical protein